MMRLAAFLLGVTGAASMLAAAPADDIQKQLRTGSSSAAARDAESAVRAAPDNEDLNVLLVRSLLEVGRYADANAAVASGLSNLPQSIRLRWIGREAAFASGRPESAGRLADEIEQLM
jgi:predicted Zn-dependent protease